MNYLLITFGFVILKTLNRNNNNNKLTKNLRIHHIFVKKKNQSFGTSLILFNLYIITPIITWYKNMIQKRKLQKLAIIMIYNKTFYILFVINFYKSNLYFSSLIQKWHYHTYNGIVRKYIWKYIWRSIQYSDTVFLYL